MEEEKFSPKKNLPRDLFLHLLAIITLYWSAVSFITLLWQFINYFFPDPLNREYSYFNFSNASRFSIASLIIVFPVYIFCSWYLNRIYKKESETRDSKIRKWLLYLTIFVVSLVIIGDLVSVIHALLGGELAIRFILKSLVVLIVALIIFGYYLDDIIRKEPNKLNRYFALIVILLVSVSVIGAFLIIGSPLTIRLIEFDQRKISDLQEIQSRIIFYWQTKERLPENILELEDSVSGFKVPRDPQTGKLYEYKILDRDNLSFEICAEFNKEGKLKEIKTPQIASPFPENWDHPSGRYCFQRKIDKDFYSPLKTSHDRAVKD